MEIKLETIYCRLCLTNAPNNHNFIDVTTNDCQLHDKIVQIFHFEMNSTEAELSPYICLICQDRVESIANFIETVQKNQEDLKITKISFVKQESGEIYLKEDNENYQLCHVTINDIKLEDIPLSPPKTTTKRKREPVREELFCDICGKSFMLKYLLVNHMQKHMAEPSFECEFCNKRFRTTKQLNSHKIQKHEKLGGSIARYYDKIVDISNYLFCELCEGNPKFDTFELMNEHYLSSHGVRGYVLCCNRIFRTKRSVVIHCDRHLTPVDYM